MKKRVILVYPNIVTGWQARPRMAMPMSLLCIANPAIEAGFDVKIIDQRVEPRWKAILMQELKDKPLCVGVSSMTGPQLKYALEISRIVKEHGTTPVVWGGTHASLLPAQTLENEFIDIVVEGEGEETFPELLEALDGKRELSSVRGIWFKDNDKVIYTGRRPFIDLNKLTALPYHLIDLNKFTRTMFDIEHLDFFTSRGCPHQCAFCYNASFHKKQWRTMDPDLVVKRIKDFVQTYKVKGLFFNDSNFYFDLDRGREILRGLIREDVGVCISNINIDFLTMLKMRQEDFDLLKRVHCKRIPIAVESGSERIQNLLKKPVDAEQLLKINTYLKESGIAIHYAFMMGFPTETKEDLAQSISLAFRLLEENPNADTSFNIFTPFPGTELFDIALSYGLKFPQRLEDWNSFNYRTLTQGAPWLSEEMQHLVQVMDFCAFFMGSRPFLKPYEKTSALTLLLSRMYAPLARKRLKYFYDKFPVEMKLAKYLGIYARQN